MKKFICAILLPVLLLASGCQSDPFVSLSESSRLIEYKAVTFRITVNSGDDWTLSGDYDWVTPSATSGKDGDKLSFEVGLNLTGQIRKAEFTITSAAASETFVLTQKSGQLDAAVTMSIKSMTKEKAYISVNVVSDNIDDYDQFGAYLSETTDTVGCKKFASKKEVKPKVGENLIDFKINPNADNYVWVYLRALDGSQVVTAEPVLMIAPICVREGMDLQAAIDNARDGAEIRLQGDCEFGPIEIRKSGITISGSWNETFSAQEPGLWTILDGGNESTVVMYPKVNGAGSVNSPKYTGVKLNRLKIQNGYARDAAGVNVQGDMVIDNCWIDNNTSEHRGGGIGCTENANRDSQEKINLVICNSVISNNATKEHGGGLSVEEGMNVTAVNNLFYGNTGTEIGGGWSSTLCVYWTSQFVNNTFTNNNNCDDNNRGNWPGILVRMVDDPGLSFYFVNNIVAGNYAYSKENDQKTDPYRQVTQFKIEKRWREANVIQNNIFEGAEFACNSEGDPMPGGLKAMNQVLESPVSMSTIFKSWTGMSWQSLAWDGYSLNSTSIAANAGLYDDYVKALLNQYNTDLGGDKRISKKIVDIGCYEFQFPRDDEEEEEEEDDEENEDE